MRWHVTGADQFNWGAGAAVTGVEVRRKKYLDVQSIMLVRATVSRVTTD